MNSRQSAPKSYRVLRGMQIAATRKITWFGGNVLLVESQTSGASYSVEIHDDGTVSCSCPDWKRRRRSKCKHGEAVGLSLARYSDAEIAAWPSGYVIPKMDPPATLTPSEDKVVRLYDGARRRPPVRIDFPTGRKERSRRAAAYAKMRERVPQHMADLCSTVREPRRPKRGGQEMLLHDKLFCLLFRIFANRPLLDVVYELRLMAQLGFLEWAPGRNSLCEYVHDSRLTSILEDMLLRTARKVRYIEKMALVDSTAIASIKTANYLDTDRGLKIFREENSWFKCHVVCGGMTGLVAGVVITNHKRKIDNNDESEPTADVNFWKDLIPMAASVWDVAYALGDKAYLSDANIQICDDHKIKTCIPIKRGWDVGTKLSSGARELFKFYTEENAFFEDVYRYRSKVEGVFSAVKRVCGHYVWSRGTRLLTDRMPTPEELERAKTAYHNEMLAKFVVLNLRTIVMLEELHDDKMNFATDRAFQPLPMEWRRTADMDEALDVAAGDFESDEDSESA